VRANANRRIDARKRIAAALDEMKAAQRYFSTDELRKAAKCSKETLYKHTDIWENDYEDLASGFFAISTGEYNDVVGAGSPQTKPPTTSLEQDMPPGRLAARRIIYEISMRSERDKRQAQKKAAESVEREATWQDNVTRHTTPEPSSLSAAEIKVLLVILATYLATAPSYESQCELQMYIGKLRKQLNAASNGPCVTVRPPPE
jgi:hypothetical protein